MEHQELNIQVYVREDGTSPYYEWIDSIKDKKLKSRIFVRIDKLACGHFGDYKSVLAKKFYSEFKEKQKGEIE